MAVMITIDFEASGDDYDAVNEKIDTASNPPEGLIAHAGCVNGSEMHVVDIWESEQHFTDFSENRLGPAIGEVMGDSAPQPNISVLEVHDLFKP